ncbi:hypothetical protein B0H19DRAFT_1375033 [Mycena capillaripes]|nr:hypothetical protein B0H19DRAFT_1375033 [Mycena capillaripes]
MLCEPSASPLSEDARLIPSLRCALRRRRTRAPLIFALPSVHAAHYAFIEITMRALFSPSPLDARRPIGYLSFFALPIDAIASPLLRSPACDQSIGDAQHRRRPQATTDVPLSSQLYIPTFDAALRPVHRDCYMDLHPSVQRLPRPIFADRRVSTHEPSPFTNHARSASIALIASPPVATARSGTAPTPLDTRAIGCVSPASPPCSPPSPGLSQTDSARRQGYARCAYAAYQARLPTLSWFATWSSQPSTPTSAIQDPAALEARRDHLPAASAGAGQDPVRGGILVLQEFFLDPAVFTILLRKVVHEVAVVPQ